MDSFWFDKIAQISAFALHAKRPWVRILALPKFL